jgi:hypothetical protein
MDQLSTMAGTVEQIVDAHLREDKEREVAFGQQYEDQRVRHATELQVQAQHWTEILAARDAEIADLRAQLDGLLPKSLMRVGVSIPSKAVDTADIYRTYDSSDERLTPAPKDKIVAHSFKRFADTEDEMRVRQWVRDALTGSLLIFWHECDDNIEKGTLKVEYVQRGLLAIARIIVEEGRVGEIHPCSNFTSWAVKSSSKVRNAIPGQVMSSAVVQSFHEADGYWTWDAYAGPEADQGAPKPTPEELFGRQIVMSALAGLPTAFLEVGAQYGPNSDPKGHAAWWRTVFKYLRSKDVRAVIAWNRKPLSSKDPSAQFTYAIQDTPEVLAVWVEEMKKIS